MPLPPTALPCPGASSSRWIASFWMLATCLPALVALSLNPDPRGPDRCNQPRVRAALHSRRTQPIISPARHPDAVAPRRDLTRWRRIIKPPLPQPAAANGRTHQRRTAPSLSRHHVPGCRRARFTHGALPGRNFTNPRSTVPRSTVPRSTVPRTESAGPAVSTHEHGSHLPCSCP